MSQAGPPSSVVGDARARFAQRQRLRRWRSARPLLIVCAVLVALGVAVWVLWFSSLLSVRAVDVHGTRALTDAQVRAAAEVPDGEPLARLDTGAVRDRVARIPGVARVRVSRSWPSTVRITVTEREPLAGVARDNQIWLVDRKGVLFQKVDGMPRGMPTLQVSGVGPDSERARAALTVLDALPDNMRAQVLAVTAESPESVEFSLRDGRQVVWGGADRSAEKVKVLEPLLGSEGKVFDVSSPSVVVVR